MQLSNPYAWALLFATLITVGLLPLVWQRRRVPGITAVLFVLIGVSVWSFGYAMQLFNVKMGALLFWTKIVYIGIVTVSASWLVFALGYTGRARWLSQRFLWVLLIEPVLMLVLVWSNEYHGLIYRQVALIQEGAFVYLTPVTRGPAFWAHIAYSYGLLAIATVILLEAVIRSPGLYRGQVGMMMLAIIAPWIGNVTHLLLPGLPIDPTPLTFAITGLAVVFGIVRFQLFNLAPIARDLVVESMADVLIVLDDLNRIADANPAAEKWLGRKQNQIVGRPFDALDDQRMSSLQPFLDDAPAQGEVNLGSEGAPYWYDLRSSLLFARSGGPVIGRLLVLHDIQERKRTEEMLAQARDQAMQASLAKSQLIANVSHDLRAPVNAVLGFGQLLRAGAGGPLNEQQVDLVAQMVRSGQQAHLFINDLLDHALIERGQLTLYPAPFRVANLLGSIQLLFHAIALEKGLLLECQLEPSMPEILYGDEKRLQQILINLVENAIKYSEQGTVAVHLCLSEQNTWTMQVSDNGRGIPPEAQAYIFEPFRQVEGPQARRVEGTGLGLAIVSHLVKMMEGRIDLESQPGQGSTFRIILPLQRPS